MLERCFGSGLSLSCSSHLRIFSTYFLIMFSVYANAMSTADRGLEKAYKQHMPYHIPSLFNEKEKRYYDCHLFDPCIGTAIFFSLSPKIPEVMGGRKYRQIIQVADIFRGHNTFCLDEELMRFPFLTAIHQPVCKHSKQPL